LGGPPCAVRDPQKVAEKRRGVSRGSVSLREVVPGLGSACSWASRETARRSPRKGDFLPQPPSAWENHLPPSGDPQPTAPSSFFPAVFRASRLRTVGVQDPPNHLLGSPGPPASGPGPQTAPTGWKGVSGPAGHGLAPDPRPGRSSIRPSSQPSGLTASSPTSRETWGIRKAPHSAQTSTTITNHLQPSPTQALSQTLFRKGKIRLGRWMCKRNPRQRPHHAGGLEEDGGRRGSGRARLEPEDSGVLEPDRGRPGAATPIQPGPEGSP